MQVMTKDLKLRWIEALRSGKYKQGRSHLKNGDQYCCLGVLCEVAALEKTAEGGYKYENYSSISRLPVTFEKGIDCNYLISLNDTQLKTFDEIANYIEENIVGQ